MEKAVLVLTSGDLSLEEEMESLARTAGYSLLRIFRQRRRRGRGFYIGKGKVDEIRGFLQGEDVDLVLFDAYLTTRQAIRLEEVFGALVVDKFDLILNLFEGHARSREAKLQIELARLKKKIPYIQAYLSQKVRRQHPGFGASGEYIVRSTVSGIRKRVQKLERELGRFQKRTSRHRRRRQEGGKTVSLAGYTNAGKTTLFNALTRSEKAARDELFTTLQTKTSHTFIDGRKVFVNDTLGFLQDLPHELIYAFQATLEDLATSDLILLVLDASDPLEIFEKKRRVCEETLVKVGADRVPRLYVLNKRDLSHDIQEKAAGMDGCISISAKKGTGLGEIREAISRSL
jgi:GTP-binding protein HflX